VGLPTKFQKQPNVVGACQEFRAKHARIAKKKGAIYLCILKLEERLNVIVSNSPILSYLPIVSRKARKDRKEKKGPFEFVHYLITSNLADK
jgi:hypothetical protein